MLNIKVKVGKSKAKFSTVKIQIVLSAKLIQSSHSNITSVLCWSEEVSGNAVSLNCISSERK